MDGSAKEREGSREDGSVGLRSFEARSDRPRATAGFGHYLYPKLVFVSSTRIARARDKRRVCRRTSKLKQDSPNRLHRGKYRPRERWPSTAFCRKLTQAPDCVTCPMLGVQDFPFSAVALHGAPPASTNAEAGRARRRPCSGSVPRTAPGAPPAPRPAGPLPATAVTTSPSVRNHSHALGTVTPTWCYARRLSRTGSSSCLSFMRNQVEECPCGANPHGMIRGSRCHCAVTWRSRNFWRCAR